MFDKGIELHASAMDKLKASFYKASKKDAYEHLARRTKHRPASKMFMMRKPVCFSL